MLKWLKQSLYMWHWKAVGYPTLIFSGKATDTLRVQPGEDLVMLHPETGLTCRIRGKGWAVVLDGCQFDGDK